jgi:hypothetical protein
MDQPDEDSARTQKTRITRPLCKEIIMKGAKHLIAGILLVPNYRAVAESYRKAQQVTKGQQKN